MNFVHDTDGSIPGNLLWFVAIAAILGVSHDTANAWRVQHKMQVASDASALVAAAHVDDPDTARTMALDLARRNLGDDAPISEEDIIVGVYNQETGAFVQSDTNANAVRVDFGRTGGNSLPTHLMWLSGVNSLDIHAGSFAMAPEGPGCEDATILTTDFLNTGGFNNYIGNICLHGEQGVLTGGNDFWSPDVRISAASVDDVTINTVAEGSATAEEIRLGRSMEPKILPNLNTMFSDAWADANTYAGSTYQGDVLPAFLKGANVVVLTESWTVLKEPGTLKRNEQGNPGVVEVQSNTIYIAPGSLTFEGQVDASNIAVLAGGQIIIGGGFNLYFQNVFFFAEGDINASGTIRWGHPDTYCNTGMFNTYLFSKTALSLGGAAGTYGVVGAAPRFAPGGALESAGGLYFEASMYTSLGGRYDVSGCGTGLESAYEIARPGRARIRGSVLLQ